MQNTMTEVLALRQSEGGSGFLEGATTTKYKVRTLRGVRPLVPCTRQGTFRTPPTIWDATHQSPHTPRTIIRMSYERHNRQ
jgi:hypothetical protein